MGELDGDMNSAPVSIGRGFLLRRPLLQHPRPLPDGHADPRPVLGPTVKDALGLIQAAAGEQQLDHALAVARPLLHLVEVAMIRD